MSVLTLATGKSAAGREALLYIHSDSDLHLALASLAPYIGDNSSHNRSALAAAVHQQRLSQARELLEALKPPMDALD
jgi:hypothetical protein